MVNHTWKKIDREYTTEITSIGAETEDISLENGHRGIMKERKLTRCNNGRNWRTGIMRGEGVKGRRYVSVKEDRDSVETTTHSPQIPGSLNRVGGRPYRVAENNTKCEEVY